MLGWNVTLRQSVRSGHFQEEDDDVHEEEKSRGAPGRESPSSDSSQQRPGVRWRLGDETCETFVLQGGGQDVGQGEAGTNVMYNGSTVLYFQLLVEFHNSEPASSETPPPSPSSGVRVSVIKHTKDEQSSREEAGGRRSERSERSWEKAREKYPDFSSFCRLEVRSPPTESSYSQQQEIFVSSKNTDREGERTARPAIFSPKSPLNLHRATLQRPVILPKMTPGPTVFQTSSSLQSREKSFCCNFSDCEKSYYKLSHLKAHYRVHTGRQHGF